MEFDHLRNNKKKALLEKKERILEELKYYNQRMKQVRSELDKPRSLEDYGSSSDSDNEFPVLKPTTPSTAQLTQKQKMLQTCLQATEELTGLEVLQYEVNVVVKEPELDHHSRINEAGTWREVVAECKMDQISFGIEFYAFKRDGKFAPTLYRGLRVTPNKQAQEKELSKSVLPTTKTPSDAVEVLHNYSIAYRSRRFTLARLMDKFGPALFLEPLADGGFHLKCADVLEISWTLQNTWSPIAPFQHKLKFDLESLEENYMKRITQLYREVSDPLVETEERTLLLASIISTCLEDNPPLIKSSIKQLKDYYTGLISNIKTENYLKRITQLYRQVSDPMVETEERTLLLASIISTCLEANPPLIESSVEEPSDVEVAKRDSEVMAPPKSAPKRTRPKTKENDKDITSSDEEVVKRTINEDDTAKSAKKTKTNEGSLESVNKTDKKQANVKAVQENNALEHTEKHAKPVKRSNNEDDPSVDAKKSKQSEVRLENKTTKSAVSENDKGLTEKPQETKGKTDGKPKQSKSSAAQSKKPSSTEKKYFEQAFENQTKDVPNTKDKNAASAKSNPEKVIKTNFASKISEKTIKGGKAKVDQTGKENKVADKKESNENSSEKPANDKKLETSESSNKNDQKNTNNGEKVITKAKTQAGTKNIANNAKGTQATNVASKIATRSSLTNLNTDNAPNKALTAHNSDSRIVATTSKQVNIEKKPKEVANKIITTNSGKKVINTVKTITNDKGEVVKKVVKKLVNPNEGNRVKPAEKPTVTDKKIINPPKSGVASNKGLSDKNLKGNVTGISKPIKENMVKTTTVKSTTITKPMASSTIIVTEKTGNTEKENTVKKVGSKIPQIKSSTPKKIWKKAPLRVSPRKPIPKPKSPLVGGKKVVLKPVTNIPRLLNKQKPKEN